MITVDFSRLRVDPGDRILDIGCGAGRHTCEAFRLQDVVVIGADLSFDDLIEAREKLRLHESLGEHGGGTWGLSVADIGRLPFESDAFDLVICSEVLEHIPDEERAVREIVRVLKPGKNLALSVPRYFPEKICWALSSAYNTASGGHIRIYRKPGLVALLDRAGLKKWGEHFAHSLHSPYWWLKCLLGPERENSPLVTTYHRFLVWDMMQHPWLTRFLDRMLNPLMGKSIALYLRKL